MSELVVPMGLLLFLVISMGLTSFLLFFCCMLSLTWKYVPGALRRLRHQRRVRRGEFTPQGTVGWRVVHAYGTLNPQAIVDALSLKADSDSISYEDFLRAVKKSMEAR
jgi:hypothetical protein